MKRVFFLLIAASLAFTLEAASAGAGVLQLDAPGGLEYEEDGTILASGLPDQPLVAVLGEYELRGGKLRYDAKRRMAAVTGGVLLRWKRPEGARTIEAETLTFSFADETAQAEGRVRLENEEVRLEAQSLKADLKEESYTAAGYPAQARLGGHFFAAETLGYDRDGRLSAGGKVVWEMAGPEKRVLAASCVEYDRRRGLAEASEVEAAAGEFLLRGGRLSYEEAADRFILTENASLQDGERRLAAPFLSWEPARNLFTASGGASFQDGSYSGAAGEIRYEAGTERILLSGQARLARNGDVLTGAEILCELKTGRLHVGGRAKARISMDEEG